MAASGEISMTVDRGCHGAAQGGVSEPDIHAQRRVASRLMLSWVTSVSVWMPLSSSHLRMACTCQCT